MRLNAVILTVVVVVSGFAAGGSGVAAAADSATLAQSDCTFPVSVTDTTGTEVTAEERPERVVVLQPSDAQAAWAVGPRTAWSGCNRPNTRPTSTAARASRTSSTTT